MKYKITLFFISTMLFLSCSNSDDNFELPKAKSLNGTWGVKEIIYTNPVVGTIKPDVQGFLFFGGKNFGREEYEYSVSGTPILNASEFTWNSTDEEIVFNEKADNEIIWKRIRDTEDTQVCTFSKDDENVTITITLERVAYIINP